MIHLCKAAECQAGDGLHCTSYDSADAEALVDLGAEGFGSDGSSRPAFADWPVHFGMLLVPATSEVASRILCSPSASDS